MPWKIDIGIHDGTVTGRDSNVVTTKNGGQEPLESLEDCQNEVKQLVEWYARKGYGLWYCNIIAPDGSKHESGFEPESYG